MNNSDPTLSSFEEQLTAYLDGRMSDTDSAAFEKAHPDVAAERSAHAQMQTLLRTSTAPALSHPEFFNRQILREIESPRVAARGGSERSVFGFWRLAFAAAFCFLAAFGIHRSITPSTPKAPDYFAEVLSVEAGDENIKARTVPVDGMVFVMIDGLEPMSEEFILN
jgi:anti-sigma factor RsiW